MHIGTYTNTQIQYTKKFVCNEYVTEATTATKKPHLKYGKDE